MAATAQQKASARMVVLLRPSEKQRLQKQARKERVSSAEIVRRSLAAYTEPVLELDGKVIAEANLVLNQMLTRIQSTLAHLQNNRTQIQEMRAKKS